MKKYYVILLVAILAMCLVISVVWRDVIFVKQQEYKQTSYLKIREVDVRPLEVTNSFVDINITAYLDHTGGETNNASMVIKLLTF